ncbi:MAG: L-threonylcarbamoyladenylate synthase [Candidatus Brocadiia bacterium]
MRARTLRAGLDDEGLAHIEQAARMLAEGRLVAFPTETVYGIGCNAWDEEAVRRLREVKRRPRGKPFSIHIARLEDVASHVEHVPRIAQKLMRRYWPGPLTLVLPGKSGQAVGLRMPSNRIALELLRRVPAPVYAPSANRAGETPAKSAQEVADALGEELDLVLDGGPTTLGQASTVVRVDDDSWETLRAGSVTEDMIRRTLGTTIVFVCTANSCRSPMAEALCKQLLARRLGCTVDQLPYRGYNVLSAGTAATWDLPPSTNAVEAMERHGIDISAYRSRPVTPGLIEDADVIFVLARHHGESIRSVMPEAAPKIRLLDPSGQDVRDPVGGSPEVFLRCAKAIRRHLVEVIDTL